MFRWIRRIHKAIWSQHQPGLRIRRGWRLLLNCWARKLHFDGESTGRCFCGHRSVGRLPGLSRPSVNTHRLSNDVVIGCIKNLLANVKLGKTHLIQALAYTPEQQGNQSPTGLHSQESTATASSHQQWRDKPSPCTRFIRSGQDRSQALAVRGSLLTRTSVSLAQRPAPNQTPQCKIAATSALVGCVSLTSTDYPRC